MRDGARATGAWRRAAAGAALCLACAGAQHGAEAGEPLRDIVHVEEEWELAIKQTEAAGDLPQVTCVFSPVGNLASLRATFELNCQQAPGGAVAWLELRLWDGERRLNTRSFPAFRVPLQEGRVVRWKQGMSLAGRTLTFRVVVCGGPSGSKPGAEARLETAVATSLTNLSGYRAAISTRSSGVDFAADRVQALVLKTVRTVTAAGEVREHDTASVVYPQAGQSRRADDGSGRAE
jgi:hypothetical protein